MSYEGSDEPEVENQNVEDENEPALGMYEPSREME